MVATKELHTSKRPMEFMSVSKAKKTTVVRIHEDVAMLADILSPAFNKTTPDFLSDILRPVLERMKSEAAEKIMNFQLDSDKNSKKK